ncbi:hypothetical protein [Brevibacillus formosus]|uniref:hypothetical protein n=1 Tax=Brevibacillus formosus TaxID=54913 RepID=UPI0012FDC3B5|nr:hypothetical protein [Brevibacillus formosus]
MRSITQKLYGRYAIRNNDKVELDPGYSDGSYDYLAQDWYKAVHLLLQLSEG